MIYLAVNETYLEHELSDVIRLFYGMEDIVPHEAPEQRIKIEFFAAWNAGQGSFECCVSEQGRTPLKEQVTSPIPAADDIIFKRLMRRSAKLCLYRALKRHTGLSQPWGALTGIRPTKLMRQLMDEGMSFEEAHELLGGPFEVEEEKLSLLTDILRQQQGVWQLGTDDVYDAYIGVPMCATRCLYCSFASVDLSRTRVDVSAYADALQREIREVGGMLNAQGKRVRAVYVGGGTPTSIGRENLQRVLQQAKLTFKGAQEFTVEAGRPDALDDDMLHMLHDMGDLRITINPQTMNGETLSRIGRAHTPEDTVRAMNKAQQLGFDSINMDLILGLPGETRGDMTDTLKKVIDLGADNITVHTLAIKRASRLKEKLDNYPVASADVVEEMVNLSRRMMNEAGLMPYYMYRQKFMTGNFENVGYCRSGKECIYNIDMMEETHNILSIGAGGISKRMFYDRALHTRYAHAKNVADYLTRLDEFIAGNMAFFS